MSRRPRSAHLSIDQPLRQFERLESRLLLSFVVAEVDPAPGARLSAAPTFVTVRFNKPIEPFSLSMSDIVLGEVADDGSVSPLEDATQDLGPEPDRLVLTPNRALASGRYRILLRNESGLMSTDGEGLDVGGTGEEFRALGDFWIVTEGVGLDDAIDLGTPGPIPTTVGGVLDFGADPHGVRLYKITLPAGDFWRLGLEVTSQRDGETLDSALALFDAQGRRIAGADAGRPDAPYDPYLFTGLEAGTYYIGVSGTGDLPAPPDGYDPASATPGSVVQVQAGGSFTLHLVADPADAPITLLSMVPDRHDPRDPTPTGFTLQFSGAILFGSLSRGVKVVDRGGRTWPVVASHYLEYEARISFLFQDRLPEGEYVVRLPGQGGLVDLAGLSPITPDHPPGVLGGFSVGPKVANDDPHDLGVLLPGPGAVDGVSGRASLAPDQSAEYRVVITYPYFYSFRSRYAGGPLAISRIGPDGSVALDAGEPDRWNVTNQMFLAPGEYFFRLTATGTRPVDVEIVLKGPFDELPLANGVGQGPALSLRLIAIEVPEPPSPGPVPTPVDPVPPHVPAAPPTPPSALLPLPVDPTPIQPIPGGDESTPPPPRSPSIQGGGVAGFPVDTFAGRLSPVSDLGSFGDLIGRPSPEGRISVEFDPGSERGGTASDSESLGVLQQFGRERVLGHRFGPRVTAPSDDQPTPETDVPADVPIPVKVVAITKVSDRASWEPIPLSDDLLRRLDAVIGSWVEAWLHESHRDDGGDVGTLDLAPIATHGAGSNPLPLQQSSLVSPASIASATVIGLAIFLFPRSRRWVNRLRCGRSRTVSAAVRPGTPDTSGPG